jgi:CubicO group peptidase (beta-lactamase class C family)
MRGVAIIALAVAATVSAAGSEIVTGPVGARVDAYLTRLSAFGFSGAALVATGGQVVLSKGYGMANREKAIPYTSATISDLGSITKQFTAAGILKLEMQGKLRTDDPISRYLPGVPADKSAITLHQLLTHSAGLRAEYGGADEEDISRDDLVKKVLSTPLAAKPGERFEYSNENFSLLAAIIEIASGRSYEQFLHDELFVPAGMTETGYLLPKWAPDSLAHGYKEDGADWGLVYKRGWRPEGPGWYLAGNGGIHSTLADLYKWDRALTGDAVLNAAERKKLFTPYVATLGGGHYAYGWGVQQSSRNTTVISHNGGNTVFTADFRRYVDEGTTIIAFSNAPITAAGIAPRELDALVFGAPAVTLPPAVIDVPREQRAPLAGTYVITGAGGGSITVTPAGRGLAIESNSPALFPLLSGLTAPGGRYADRESQTKGLIEAGAKGDFEPIVHAFNDDRPPSVIEGNHTRFWADWRSRFGEYSSVDILGTTTENGDVGVAARINFSKGAVVVRYFWGPRRLVGFGVPDSAPPATFLPESTQSYVLYAFATRTVTRATFTATGVTIESGSVKVIATK